MPIRHRIGTNHADRSYCGRHEPMDGLLDERAAASQVYAFRRVLVARAVMATMTNLSLALAGHGDLDFAKAQLARFEDFLAEIDAV